MRLRTYLVAAATIILALTQAHAAAWTPVPSPLGPWASPGQQGTVLPGGRVFLVGGGADSRGVGVFDPATMRWTAGSRFPGAWGIQRAAIAAIDGGRRIIVTGGCDFLYCSPDRRTWIYDLTLRTWAAGPFMAAARESHSLAVLGDGRVLVFGGTTAIGDVANPFAEIYASGATVWTATAAPSPAVVNLRGGITATLLRDGRVLVIGGEAVGRIYQPATNRWLVTGATFPRAGHTATRLNDGRVIVAGTAGGNAGRTELFNPATLQFSAGPSLLVPRPGGHGATLIEDGRILISGGIGAAGSRSELFDPARGTLSAGPNLNAARTGAFTALVADTALSIGGAGAAANSAEEFLP